MMSAPPMGMVPPAPSYQPGTGQVQMPQDLGAALLGLQDPMMAAMQARDQGGGYGGMSPLMAALLGLLTQGGRQPLAGGDPMALQAILGGGGMGQMLPGMGGGGMMGASAAPPMY